MKYIMKNADGTAAVGTIKAEWGEFIFTASKQFSNYDAALDYLYETAHNSAVQFRTVREASVVPVKFLEDLCKKADGARKHRDEEAAEAGIKILCRSHYEGHRNPKLECYTSDFGDTFEYEGDSASGTPACRRFWAEQNYLIGFADSVWELGFTLCYNTETGKHEVKGNYPKLVIEADSNSED